ncbi:MAG: hypothetical protein JEZ12_27600 [Desulfobacterium sp.]|nr:hypothetical protein [Desulfobacterium sp.]
MTGGFIAEPWTAFFVPEGMDAEDYIASDSAILNEKNFGSGSTESEAVAILFKGRTDDRRQMGLFEYQAVE